MQSPFGNVGKEVDRARSELFAWGTKVIDIMNNNRKKRCRQIIFLIQ